MTDAPDLDLEQPDSELRGDDGQRQALVGGEHGEPRLYLGPHAATIDGVGGTVVRVYRPGAECVEVLVDERVTVAEPLGDDVFAAWLAGHAASDGYRLRLTFDDRVAEIDDPYRFPSQLSDFDLYLIHEGSHEKLWQRLGARQMAIDGVAGWSFAVWAPNARRVSLVGEFCHWDGRMLAMNRRGMSGVFELFMPGLDSGTTYKFELLGQHGEPFMKADPLALWAEKPPRTASRTFASDHAWGDDDWMQAATTRDVRREPMAIYEVHLGSWGGGEERIDDDLVDYRQLARDLVAYVKKLGFRWLELMPVAEHPYHGSWGYQISGYFAPTARFGTPDDFRFFVDHCHQNGVGVILDWVPAHFVRDAHGLGRFDGSALYEHEDPRLGEHQDWGTYIFNYSRFEVRNFLVANVLYWLEEFHIDGLRIDAVASMLYLDYSRKHGEWSANEHGGREHLEAIRLIHEVNQKVAELYPGRFTIAEESTAYSKVTGAVAEGGLGFTFKWNMGWMHDTLSYFGVDPLFRSGAHDQLAFAMVYEYSEAFINPLSHDEVVHMKGSLLRKMHGDAWQKLANLRTLLTYQLTRPGKKLLFMGSELASPREWDHQTGLDWFLLDDPQRRGLFELMRNLTRIYHQYPSLWRLDHQPDGFQWLVIDDRRRSVVAFARYAQPRTADAAQLAAKDEDALVVLPAEEDERDHLIVVLNLTPVPRTDYRIPVPRTGAYQLLLCTDDELFGGSGYQRLERVETEPIASTEVDGVSEKAKPMPTSEHQQAIAVTLPPLAALIMAPVDAVPRPDPDSGDQ